MPDVRRGIFYGAAAYVIWGLFPLYWPLLKPAGPVEILAHRIVWSLAAVLALVASRRQWGRLREFARRPGTVGLLVVAAALITVNWGIYIYAVNSGHVVEAALGYFINPLVSVVLGVIVFGERLRVAQWAAVALGGVAVTVLTLDYGQLPWIALSLAVSFGTYGMLKKFANAGAAESLTIETAAMFLPALGYLVALDAGGSGTFGHGSVGHSLLLVGAGVVTAVPLLFFSGAAVRVPLSVMGLMQYVTPVLQFLIGVLIAREAMPASRWIGFTLVWAALAILSGDGLRHGRARRRGASATRAARRSTPEPARSSFRGDGP